MTFARVPSTETSSRVRSNGAALSCSRERERERQTERERTPLRNKNYEKQFAIFAMFGEESESYEDE